MQHTRATHLGTTLIETLVAIAILLVVGTTIAAVFVTHTRARMRAVTAAAASGDAEQGIRAIREHLAMAVAVLPNATIAGVRTTTGADALAFEIPAISPSGTVLTGRDRMTVGRNADAPALLELRIEPALGSRLTAGTRVIARAVEHFAIRYDATVPTAARIAFLTLTSTERLGTEHATASYVAAVRLENVP